MKLLLTLTTPEREGLAECLAVLRAKPAAELSPEEWEKLHSAATEGAKLFSRILHRGRTDLEEIVNAAVAPFAANERDCFMVTQALSVFRVYHETLHPANRIPQHRDGQFKDDLLGFVDWFTPQLEEVLATGEVFSFAGLDLQPAEAAPGAAAN